MGALMRWIWLIGVAGLNLAGCASGQLNYNTLDLASTTDTLLTSQVIDNLARFIESSAAVPAQVILNGGTTTTANTVTPQFTDPLNKAVTVGTTIATAAASTTTQSVSSVTGSKSFTFSASNVATQNWAFEPITDQDQLRRLYDLYRFAVSGNNNTSAQEQLVNDYPLPFKTMTVSGTTSTVLDMNAITGPNCVVCNAGTPAIGVQCKNLSPPAYKRPEFPEGCLVLNPRLLPKQNTNSPWLRWTNLGRPHPGDEYRAPRRGDPLIGQRGNYLLYVDQDQADRFAEFALLIAGAANSSPSSSSATGAGGNAPKAKGAIATPTGILLSQ
jgi:hypothetical protein